MAKGTFEAALRLVLKDEGGYVDHPSDPGGATNMGITRKTLARWRNVSPWWNLQKSEIKALSVAEAAKIYKANYWDAVKGDALPAGIDYALFDYAVNSGPDRAVRTLQEILGVTADGAVGPLTIGAAEKADAVKVINAICDKRMAFLRGLSTFKTFGRGWTSRVGGVRSNALGMANAAPVTPVQPAPDPPPQPSKPGGLFWPAIILVAAAALAAFLLLPIFPKG